MIYTAPNECSVLLYDWHRVYRLLLLNSTFRYTLHGKLILLIRPSELWMKAAQRARKICISSMRNGEKQGDIVGIVDSADNLVLKYKYDVWGKLLSITGTLKTSLGIIRILSFAYFLTPKVVVKYY